MSSPEPTEQDTRSPSQAILGLRGGQAVLVSDEPEATPADRVPSEGPADRVLSGGRIYTRDMPALQQVLQELGVVTAVLEMPAPQVEAVSSRPSRPESHPSPPKAALAPWRVIVGGGAPVATTVAGALLLVGGVTPRPIVPNPYVGLFLLLAGVVLIVTAVLALRDSLTE